MEKMNASFQHYAGHITNDFHPFKIIYKTILSYIQFIPVTIYCRLIMSIRFKYLILFLHNIDYYPLITNTINM